MGVRSTLPASQPLAFKALGILLLVDSFTICFAQQRSLLAVPATSTPIINGNLEEPEWKRPGEKGFIQREPSEGAQPTEETEVWFAYDEHAFYVAVRMYDQSPDSIVERLVRRDEDFESDFVYVGIDPKFDRNTGYYFGTNPSGSIDDGIFFDDNKTDNSYDPVWEVAVSRDQLGWTAELRIPYSQMRFSPQPTSVWGVDVYRRIHRKNEELFLVFHPRNDDLRVSRWLPLRGIGGIVPSPRIELRPYAAVTGKFLQRQPTSSFNQGRSDPFVFGRDYFGSFGADAKIGLTGDFTLDASVNPDFAQVEVDPAIINLTAYETYFAEKRPFFIEGSNILAFGRGGAASFVDFNWGDPTFFYSRRIGRAPQGGITHDGFKDLPDRTTILGAAKISGKTQDGWSLAGLTALTDREFGRVDSAGIRFQEEIEPLTFYGVVRAQKQFDESRQAIGVIATVVERDQREPQLQNLLAQRSFSLGVDGWSFLDKEKEWVVTGWAGLTSVRGTEPYLLNLQQSPHHYFQRPDAGHLSIDSNATTLTGWAGRAWLAKDKGNWRFNAAFGFIHPGFESNDLGFHTFTDVMNMHLHTEYHWFDPDPVFRTKWVWAAYLRENNFGGLKTGETFYWGANGQLLNYWGGWVSMGYNTEFFNDRGTRGGPIMKYLPSYFGFLGLYSDTRDDVNGTLSAFGDRGESGGWDYSFAISLNWRISTTFNMSLGPNYSRNHVFAQYVDVIADPAATQTYGNRYIFATLDQRTVSADIRADWTFAPTLSFQLYMQPYLTAGTYSEFKQLARPSSFSFNPASAPDDPSFNFKSLRMNAVLRWEYLPGSTLYFVWTNEKANVESNYGVFRLGRDFSEMLRARPDNVFSLKLTYWWSP